MAGATVSAAPYAGLVNNSNPAHNSAVGQYGIAINSHTHDPSDTTNGYGSGIPAWGPTNTLYATHGPGAAGTDWTTNYASAAAIPADPNETALAPSGTIAASAGIAAELQRIRGAINVLYGAPAAQGWNTTQPPSSAGLVHTSPLTPDAGAINVTGGITGSQLNSSVPSGTPPLTVASTDKVTNLNADLLDGLSAVATYGGGSGGALLALNGAGLYDAAAIAADGGSSTPVATPAILSDSLANIRAQFALWAAAANAGSTWTSVPNALVTGVGMSGSPPISGQVTIAGGTGISVNQTGSTLGFGFTGTAPAAGDSLTFSDFFGPSVLSGFSTTTAVGTPMATGFVVSAGTGYIPNSGGNSRKFTTGIYTITNASGAGHQLIASRDNYIDWDGTDALTGFTVTAVVLNAAAPALASGSMRLFRVRTDATNITVIVDLRPFGARPPRPSWFNALDFGAIGDGVTDCTAAVALALQAVFNAGGGTLFFPPGTYLIKGQLLFPTDVNGIMPTITILGAGCGFYGGVLATSSKSSILDMRFDGGLSGSYGAGNLYANDYAVVSGLDIVWTKNVANFSVTAGKAHINNAAGAAPVTLGASGTVNTAAWTAGTYYIDVAAGTPMVVSNLTTLNTWAANSIRIASVTIGAAGIITDVQSWRGRLAKLDCRVSGRLHLRDVMIANFDTAVAVDETPFVRITKTIVDIDNCFFQGSKQASPATSAVQDAVVFGAMGGPGDVVAGQFISQGNNSYSVFGGYGSSVRNTAFMNIRRCLYGRANANGMTFSNLTSWVYCGMAGGAPFEFDAHTFNPSYGCAIVGADVEVTNYSYAALCSHSAHNHTFASLLLSDGSTTTLSQATAAGTAIVWVAGTAGASSILKWAGLPIAVDPGNLMATVPPGELLTVANSGFTATAPSGGATTVNGTAGQSSMTIASGAGTLTAGQQVLIGLAAGTQEVVTIGGTGSFTGVSTVVPLTAPLVNTYAAVSVGVAPWGVPTTTNLASVHVTGRVVSIFAASLFSNGPSAGNNGLIGGRLISFQGFNSADETTPFSIRNNVLASGEDTVFARNTLFSSTLNAQSTITSGAYTSAFTAGIQLGTFAGAGGITNGPFIQPALGMNTAPGTVFSLSLRGINNGGVFVNDPGGLLLNAGTNLGFIGNGSSVGRTGDKMAFFGKTPIVQPLQSVDLKQSLVNLGLLSSTVAGTPLALGEAFSATTVLAAAATTAAPLSLTNGEVISVLGNTTGRFRWGSSGQVNAFCDGNNINLQGLPLQFAVTGSTFTATPSFAQATLGVGPLGGWQNYLGPPGGTLLALKPNASFGTGAYAPPPACRATAVAGTGLGIGLYAYAVTFTTATGETAIGPVTYVVTSSGNQQVNLTNLNVGPASPNAPTGRNVYRSAVGVPGTLLLLTNLPNNTATTFTDTTPDASLGAAPVSGGAGTGLQSFFVDCNIAGTSRFSIDNNGVMFAQGLAPLYRSATASGTLLVTDSTVVVNTAGITLTLPAVASVPVGRKYTIKNNNKTTTLIKTTAAGGVLLDGVDYSGATNFALSAAYGVLKVFTDGANWFTE